MAYEEAHVEAKAGQAKTVEFATCCYRLGKSVALVHGFGNVNTEITLGVDMDRDEVIHRWMLSFTALTPPITSKYELAAAKNEATKTSFVYTNKSGSTRQTEFTCSSPEMFQIQHDTFEIFPGANAEVEVILRPAGNQKQAYVLVYAVDKGRESGEVLSFTINFIR